MEVLDSETRTKHAEQLISVVLWPVAVILLSIAMTMAHTPLIGLMSGGGTWLGVAAWRRMRKLVAKKKASSPEESDEEASPPAGP
ncbi:hypothetical protein CF165_03185 [Amycolatopsis vastitatis]|uniref:Uncharacterized protein n=1 Tax=Amycolatopsis vastitatis TaxID=1905142 RepID=A0A229TIG5_9PSEU|nr:hypothetical protein CF165_03185 [Amycolatopsis vastitatis]